MDNTFEITPTENTVLDENEKNWSIEFKYDNKNFEIKSKAYDSNFAYITISRVGQNEEGEITEKYLINEVDKNEEGEITGKYVRDEGSSKLNFLVDEVANKGVYGAEEGPPEFKDNHIKYLIAESITQILLNGKIDKWISSSGTNDGSNRMYAHIEEEERLKVDLINDEEGYHFEITRKNQEEKEKI
jgi:hypothetical protein